MRVSCVLAQTALPRHLKKRQRKRLEELAEIAAHDLEHQDAAEWLIDILDRYEPDPDLEPSLGAPAGPFNTYGGHPSWDQTRWAQNGRYDLEADNDSEPDIGWGNPQTETAWSGRLDIWDTPARDWDFNNETVRPPLTREMRQARKTALALLHRKGARRA